MRSSIVTGIDIGHQSIKTVTVRLVDKEFTLIGSNELILTSAIYTDSHKVDHQQIVSKLNQLKKQLPLFCHRVAVLLPDDCVISKNVSVDSELDVCEEEMAIYEAFSRQSLTSADSLSLDFMKVAGSSGSIREESTEYLVHGTRKDIVDSYISAVSEAGLKLILMDSQAYSLLQVLILAKDKPGLANRMLLDIGKTKTTLCSFTPDKKPFHKNIAFGTDELRGADAENIALFTQSLAEHLQRQIQLYYSPDSSTGPPEMMLCGGGASIAGLPERLSEQLTFRCVTLRPFSLIKNEGAKGQLPEDDACYCSALGVALRAAGWSGGQYDSSC
ncbi:type IV pilus assembly protein PilM [Vibrio sp. JC009]|uniref:type IV pilus assembly protein PilM n=1 Tax=Vibrio sp. JC009 TaxID=2912314 RepID=UPI0023B1B04E|nr:type IV pilus assembly protein PilM [Vibrio sp. JC009]WED21633.1 type IV pilus assembly protein PilM [Vibrio sp. JC009]